MGEKKKGVTIADIVKGVSNLDTGADSRPKLKYIDIDLIDPDPANRKKLEGIDKLAQNILLVGLQQPLAVRKHPDADGRYMAVSGHRRRRAIKSLVDGGEEKFRMVPCLVAEDGESPAMTRLKLLSGNIVTQVLSSSEMAEATKDMEDCIYQLKEEGHEFPGKVRNYVAEAFNVSSSRLARLKVIREGLGEEFRPLYESNKIGESMAYVLSRFPVEFQSRLAKALKTNAGGVGGYALPGAVYLEQILKEYQDGRRWEPCMTCPDGKECKRGDVFLRHDCDEPSWGTRCGGKTCCLECEAAKSSYSACENMCSKAKAKRKAQKELADSKEQARLLKEAKKPRKETQASAQRLLPLIDAAGLEDETMLPLSQYYSSLGPQVSQIRRWANGEFEGEEALRSNELSIHYMYVERLVEAAHLLGCSTDFLLGVTDEPQPVASTSETVISFEKPQWNAGTPGVVGLYYCQVDIDGERGENLLYGAYWWDGKSWLFKQDGADISSPVVGWWPLPDKESETS